MSADFSTPTEVKCYIVPSVKAPLVPGTITRRAASKDDVVIDIKYAGICHSDIHHAIGEFGTNEKFFPMVPGHEIVGEVVAVGSNVTKFSVGDRVGVGCMVDSCRTCSSCTSHSEQYCATGAVFTYASTHKYKHCAEYTEEGGSVTQGGYSKMIVVDQNYVLRVPESIPYHAAAPLLCAGITVYSPIKHFGLQPHHKFAVAGLGGLGHMAVKFGVAMGCHTTVISRGQGKKESALNDLKASAYVDASNEEEMKAHIGKFDFILSTISAQHDLTAYTRLLATDGKLILVGVQPGNSPISTLGLIFKRQTIAGSLIGGIRETQEMLDFCGQHGLASDVELIRADQINESYERALKSDVKYRFVIDASTF